jgi:hypothetical protein
MPSLHSLPNNISDRKYHFSLVAEGYQIQEDREVKENGGDSMFVPEFNVVGEKSALRVIR